MTDRLLVMDDDQEYAAFVRKVAESGGYQVRTTDQPAEFDRIILEWNPTHIALDLAMPQADGIEMLRHLARVGSQAAIVIMSGFDTRILEAARRLGTERGLHIIASLQKPVRAKELRQIFETSRSAAEVVDRESLDNALKAGEIVPFFQPKVDLRSWEPVGFEALVRWQHGQRGTIPPDEFIPMAEANGQIDQLTETVATRAMVQARQWEESGLPVDVAINLSAHSLAEEDLADRIEMLCWATGAKKEHITFEVTESAAMADPVRGLDILTRLRIKGFKLSIDDFGTGYSSLVQLHRLPFSELKIDRTFVSECDRSSEARIIVKTMVDLAHNLGMSVVGEGVESQDVATILAEMGCDIGQGHAIARPMDGSQVPVWLSRWTSKGGSGHPKGLPRA
jgi:EAL domain-containing protein (putative c-di-GMP-specific phosphodiesterase class I)/ActR/RegA family two-component response regulator